LVVGNSGRPMDSYCTMSLATSIEDPTTTVVNAVAAIGYRIARASKTVSDLKHMTPLEESMKRVVSG